MVSPKKRWQRNVETILIGFAVPIVIALILAVGKRIPITAETVKLFLVGLNLFALVGYFLITRSLRSLEFEEHEDSAGQYQYCEKLKISYKGKPQCIAMAEGKNTRVNRLVEQLHTNIKWYAIFLVIVYFIYLFDNEKLLDQQLFGIAGIHQRVSLFFNIIIGVCNFLSAVFIYLAFKVLYDKTLKDDNKTSLPYYDNAIIFSILFLSFYIGISLAITPRSLPKPAQPPVSTLGEIKVIFDKYTEEQEKQDKEKDSTKGGNPPPAIAQTNADASAIDPYYCYRQTIKDFDKETHLPATKAIEAIKESISRHEPETGKWWSNVLKLLIGSWNGLAMALLFGRYVSMEQTVYDMKEGAYAKWKYRRFIHNCTIYILPIYALAQPLFGAFEIDEFGDAKTFANVVFFLCLIGKVFFLYLTYILMKRHLMHLYLHTALTSRGVPKDLTRCFNSDF